MRNPRYTYYSSHNDIVKKASEAGLITAEDSNLIMDHITDKINLGEIEGPRALRIAIGLTQWRRFITVPYKGMTYKQLKDGVGCMRTGSNIEGKPYTKNYIRENIAVLKSFVRYLMASKVVSITRDEIDGIKPPTTAFDSVKSRDILTPDQIEQLIGCAHSIRDKAIIGTLADTGLRPVDLTGLQWHDMDFNGQRVKIDITAQKTRKALSCYVILHRSWLVELRKQYNAAGNDDYVFLDERGRPLMHATINHMIIRLSEKSGVKFPRGAKGKLFRAVSITQKRRAGYSDAVISKMHFGSDDSAMMRHYSKLDDSDAERESLEKSGVVIVDKPEQMRPTICPECNEPISPGVRFCPSCGTPLTKEAAGKLQSAIQAVDADPGFKEYQDKIKRMDEQDKKIKTLTAQVTALMAQLSTKN